jgi:Zn-dependent M16 (insulinase) family peptidase
VGASSLRANVDILATLPREVWAETLFSDAARMRDALTQRKIALEQYFVGSGHAAALARTSTYFSAASGAASQMAGLDYYLFLKGLLADWDARAQGLEARLSALAGHIFTADEVTVSFTGNAAERERFWEAGGTLGLTPAGDVAHRLAIPAPAPRNEAFVIPSNVSYVARAAAPSSADAGTLGAWQVATRALSYDYLWNEVRVKGGAYGVGFKRTTEGLRQFWSFRDPAVDATLGRYDGAGGMARRVAARLRRARRLRRLRRCRPRRPREAPAAGPTPGHAALWRPAGRMARPRPRPGARLHGR